MRLLHRQSLIMVIIHIDVVVGHFKSLQLPKSRFSLFQNNTEPSDGRTDGRTDVRTDGRRDGGRHAGERPMDAFSWLRCVCA